MRFKDKVVLVTGGASGIGAATALEFLKEGAKISTLELNQESLSKTVNKWHEAGMKSENIFTVIGDVTNKEDQDKIVDGTIEQFGHIDILVNNAGWGISKTIQEATTEDLQKMLNVHLMAPFSITKKALPSIIQRKGVIINVESLAAVKPYPQFCTYGIAKAALAQFTKTLALEIGDKGVRVNSVAPSSVRTNLFGGANSKEPIFAGMTIGEVWEDMTKQTPLRRICDPEDIAKAILSLCHDDSNMITGVQLRIDGGLLLK